jgi:hypothetical protein
MDDSCPPVYPISGISSTQDCVHMPTIHYHYLGFYLHHTMGEPIPPQISPSPKLSLISLRIWSNSQRGYIHSKPIGKSAVDALETQRCLIICVEISIASKSMAKSCGSATAIGSLSCTTFYLWILKTPQATKDLTSSLAFLRLCTFSITFPLSDQESASDLLSPVSQYSASLVWPTWTRMV